MPLYSHVMLHCANVTCFFVGVDCKPTSSEYHHGQLHQALAARGIENWRYYRACCSVPYKLLLSDTLFIYTASRGSRGLGHRLATRGALHLCGSGRYHSSLVAAATNTCC